MLPICRKNQK